MNNHNDIRSLAQYNIDVHDIHKAEGLNIWRKLYLSFLNKIDYQSIVEIGAGTPYFLRALQEKERFAIDGGIRWKEDFNKLGVKFFHLDLDYDAFPSELKVDVAVCSDVFEHLIFPEKTLQNINNILVPNGLLFSHVPNEFTFKKMINIMFKNDTSVVFHKQCLEHNDPHFRRFTKTGFEYFLNICFKYNLFISDLNFNKRATWFNKLGLKVPFTFQSGPTFVSTNNKQRYEELVSVKNKLSI